MAFQMVTNKIASLRQGLKDWLDDIRADLSGGNVWFRGTMIALVTYLLVAGGVGIYWSGEPDLFDVREAALAMPQIDGREINGSRMVPGAITTATLIQVVDTLLNKPGGYLSNDISPPGLWLDNIPNWEFGVLVQCRDLGKAMRESFSRSQSQSLVDPDLEKAEPRLNFNNQSWALPASESEYKGANKLLRKYLERLVNEEQPDAQFFSRADNLHDWLGMVENRLGSLSQKLTASVGQKRINTDLAGDDRAERATQVPGEMVVKTPWLKIDDVFYEARGTTWALVHFLRAVELDFADVLQKKNALISLQQIIRELEATQETVYSPMILNGSGFGMLANHSLVMASYISRANAAIIDLRALLAKG